MSPAGKRCPVSGWSGKAVERHTVQALLNVPALPRLGAGRYWFCPDPACDVVYFGGDGSRFTTGDVRVRVWQKCAPGDRPICYCFAESEDSIRAEIASHGRSRAVDRVRGEIAAGRCACEVRNPRGVCCLGDLIAAVARAEAAQAPAAGTDTSAGAL